MNIFLLLNNFVIEHFTILLTAALSSPLPRDDKHSSDDHRWSLIPDSNGMRLVDLQPYEESIEPQFVAENDVRFLLFTRQNPTVGQVITLDLESLQNSHYNPNHPTHFTVHGWQSDAETESNSLVHQAFHSLGDYNVSSR